MDKVERIAKRLTASHQVYHQSFPASATLDEMRREIDRNMIDVYDPGETSHGMETIN